MGWDDVAEYYISFSNTSFDENCDLLLKRWIVSDLDEEKNQLIDEIAIAFKQRNVANWKTAMHRLSKEIPLEHHTMVFSDKFYADLTCGEWMMGLMLFVNILVPMKNEDIVQRLLEPLRALPFEDAKLRMKIFLQAMIDQKTDGLIWPLCHICSYDQLFFWSYGSNKCMTIDWDIEKSWEHIIPDCSVDVFKFCIEKTWNIVEHPEAVKNAIQSDKYLDRANSKMECLEVQN